MPGDGFPAMLLPSPDSAHADGLGARGTRVAIASDSASLWLPPSGGSQPLEAEGTNGMCEMQNHYRRFPVARGFDRTLTRMLETLHEQGFTVLKGARLRERRLGLETRLHHAPDAAEAQRQAIVWVVDPAVTRLALEADPDLAVFLPCAIGIGEQARQETIVTALEPLGLVTQDPEWRRAHPALVDAIVAAEERLGRALATLSRRSRGAVAA
jgi:uncharacterized protein (DUF302 family)